jgi:4-hydroxybenzoate polyprenyltransferase
MIKLQSIKPYIRAIRPHQWPKNILVFLPMLASHQFNLYNFKNCLFAFISFSLVASSVYIFNDLHDLEADREHPRKCNRPFASGEISFRRGVFLAIIFMILGELIAFNLGFSFLVILTSYFILTTIYTLTLKRRLVLDICVLASLYTIRIIAGGVVLEILLSVWLLAFSLFIFLSLAAVKRHAELVDMVSRGTLKSKGRGYQVEDLPIISMVGLSSGYISILVMALYFNSPSVQELYSFPSALWSICIILLYWVTRIVLITHRGLMDDDPVLFAIKDKVSLACLILILISVLAGVFF